MSSTINLTTATYDLQFYAGIILGSFALFSTILNIAVICRKKFRLKNMCFYNVIMSTLNILIIISRFFASTPSFGLPDFLLVSRLTCVLIPYFSRIVSQESVWIFVFISFDRTLLMSYKNMEAFRNRSPHLREKRS